MDMVQTILAVLLSFFSFSPTENLVKNANLNPQTSFAQIKIENLKKVSLIPNFEERLSSKEAFEKHACKQMTNGGFYSEGGKPIGLFVGSGRKIADYSPNATLNGILGYSDSGKLQITDNVQTSTTYDWAVQSGPILVKNGKPLKIASKNDEQARRVVAGIDDDGTLIFMLFKDPSSGFSGPTLAELPEKVLEKNPNIDMAINLDGGGSSLMYTHEYKITEYQSAGSFFCMLD